MTKTRPITGRLAKLPVFAALAAAWLSAGCVGPEQPLVAPVTLVAPYNTTKGEVLWAVVPLRNESGASDADKNNLSDKLVIAVEEIQGVRCMPLNRTLEAMRTLKMPAVQSSADAKKLAQAMGADGILVGSVTNYDPYTPALGISLALFARGGPMTPNQDAGVDPYLLESRPVEATLKNAAAFRDGPVATASDNLDGKNNQVLMDLRQFAQGRQEGPSALGWRRYTASMDLFSEFAVHHSVGRLVQAEWVRLANAENLTYLEQNRHEENNLGPGK